LVRSATPTHSTAHTHTHRDRTGSQGFAYSHISHTSFGFYAPISPRQHSVCANAAKFDRAVSAGGVPTPANRSLHPLDACAHFRFFFTDFNASQALFICLATAAPTHTHKDFDRSS